MSRDTIYFILLGVLIVLLFALDMLFGSVPLSFGEIIDVFRGRGETLTESIIYEFRLPKAIVAILAGAALSASGLQMQTLFKNPLAGPYVLGVSSGASLGVSLFLLGAPLLGGGEFVRSLGMVSGAWLGAALILLVTMAVTVRVKDIMVILILGMMFGSATSAIVELLQYFSSESLLKSYVIWTMGSLGGVSSSQLFIMIPSVLLGLILSIWLIKPLNMLLLGENYAVTMGLKVKRIRFVIFFSTTLLAGTITAFCGPIGFIGIAVPHVARLMFKNANHRVLMPSTIMLGAAVMLMCDIISQLPTMDITLPINTITALLGIPIVVLVVVRNKKMF